MTGISGKVLDNFTFIKMPADPVPYLTGVHLTIYIIVSVLLFLAFCVVWYYVWFVRPKEKKKQ